MMIPLILCCAATACISAALVLHMIRVGVMDVPGHRSSHTRPTPKGGGIGIITGFLLIFPLSQLWTQGDLPGPALLLPLLAVALLAFFSWLDDIHSYRASLKLGVQGVAALMTLAGVALTSLPGFGSGVTGNVISGRHALPYIPDYLVPGWVIVVVAIGIGFFWLVFTTNALNFIDGLNGLASGVMAMTALALSILFSYAGKPGFTHAALLLAVALLVFLPFNFPKARIFMGDVGSQGAGLTLAWLGIEAACATPYPLIVPFMLGGVLYDVAFTLIRRAIAGDPLAQAHRSHLYQLAARSGVSPTLVSLLHWAFALWGAVAAVTHLPVAAQSSLVLAPQLLWTGFTLHRARARDLGKW
ncbi:glycosyltransferase family 4 protein [Asaia bogorensis]|uniref:glycosyltransferase family 4 protein n=1 Tax=Asaia bogorensis TaxID=91915 RepID=UPI000EFD111D|nr:UDP-phosphate alpha N-acetylglucosaminyltransferase [Asaia bogorensis]